MDLTGLSRIFAEAGCKTVYVKRLAENDNSKNQIYLAPGFSALNLFPNLVVDEDTTGPRNKSTFKAPLQFRWVDDNGNVDPAPSAKLIFYPKYPEVRFSGFLKGCRSAPSDLLNRRMRDRVLIWAVNETGQVLGHVTTLRRALGREIAAKASPPNDRAFASLPIGELCNITPVDSRVLLLRELKRIHSQGWIRSKKLKRNWCMGSCEASNCGGYTLEAELGIRPNGISEPDYLGWEIKQHNVSRFENLGSGVITLMTPEPKAGFYAEHGALEFIKRFGYADRTGRKDRMNFGGVHKAGTKHSLTHLTLVIDGYDSTKQRLTAMDGGISLVTDDGVSAAAWPFAGLMAHWNRKHAKAAYVPSMCRKEPNRKYAYGDQIRMGVGTDFLLFLKAVSEGKVYYDPGIKAEHISHDPKVKKRSQFRVKSRDIPSLYQTLDTVALA